MGLTYLQLVGAPPSPYTFAFRAWYNRLIALRIARCNVARTTNKYFSQAGFDTEGTGANQGNGTVAHPYKTKAKAQTLIDASSGDIAVLFKRGETWSEATVLSDSGKAGVTIGAYGTATAKPKFVGGGAAADGLLISGHLSAVIGVESTGWGAANNASYPISVQCTGTNEVLVMDCDANAGGRHNIGKIGTGGGIVTVVGCRTHTLLDAAGTHVVFYGTAGTGAEGICTDLEVLPGGDGASTAAVYAHTADDPNSPMALLLVNRLRVRAGTNGCKYAVACACSPAAAAITDSRVFEIDTIQESVTANSVTPGLMKGVRINNRYACLTSNLAVSGAITSAITNGGWSVNCLFQFDATAVAAGEYRAWTNTIGVSSDWTHEHCGYYVISPNAAFFALGDYGVTWGDPKGENVKTHRSLFVIEPYADKVVLVGSTTGSGWTSNAYWNCGGDNAMDGPYDTDSSKVLLTNRPLIDALPVAGSELQITNLNGLEYDIDWRPRHGANTAIGPHELAGFAADPLHFIGAI